MGAVLLESATPVGGHDHQIDRAVEAAPVYAGLSFCFGVRCAQDDLARELDGALAPLRTDAEPSHWYTLVRTANGEVEVLLDGVAVVRARDGWWASRWLMWHVNRAVVDATCEHLLLHAGAVVTRGAGVLIPGAPGAGKSTLVAGLVQRGCGYLTDEVVALAGDPPVVLPYPKALALSARSMDAVNAEPAGTVPLKGKGKRQVVADRLRRGAVAGPAPVRVVIVPRYCAGATTELEAMDPTEALVSLVTNAVNLEHHGVGGIATLAVLAESGACFRLYYADLDDAWRVLDATFERT